MDSLEQVGAYAAADFTEAHDQLIEAFQGRFPDTYPRLGRVVERSQRDDIRE